MGFVFYQLENIVGKGANASFKHFLLFQGFQKASSAMLLKYGIVW